MPQTSTREREAEGKLPLADLINEVRRRHRKAFELAEEIGSAIEPMLRTPRHPRAATSHAMEFLAHQAHTSFLSAQLLAERALVEDAATIVRRLMELCVTTNYVGGDDDRAVRDFRARCFLVQIWEEFPAELRATLPDKERRRWRRLLDRHRAEVPQGHRCRLPKFAKRFEKIGKADTYRDDYSLLSSIAHGTSPTLVLSAAVRPVPLVSDQFVPVVLVFACRYYLGTLGLWAVNLRMRGKDSLAPLIDRAMNFFAAPKTPRNGRARP